MATNIKITALTDITSTNMTYNDLVAVVDMNGTPETKKANVQLLGNLILEGSGGSYFAKAAQATNAETVSNAAQTAITSVGTLTSLTVTGNVGAGNVTGTGGVFTYVSGDGANLTNLPSGSNSAAIANGTSNVNIPTLNGNINLSSAGTSNVAIITGTGVNVAGTLNATGNAVVGNISATNLGNVSAINLDGNVLNILHGDGSWSADATSYGDSNVVTLLNAFGSNTITTTGVITGDGSGLSAIAGANVTGSVPLATLAGTANAVAGANVSGAVALATDATTANAVALANVAGAGNIASINIDGAAANVLYGNGVFAAASSPALTGDGYQLANLTGANVTGAIAFATTANAVAYANVSGTPTLGNISTINIDGAAGNVLYGNGAFAPVSSTTAQTVTTAAQPNITSTGTLTSLTVTGALGVTTGLITGDGGGISNIAVGNLVGTINLATFAGTANAVAGANVSGEVTFAATANAVAGANVSGTVPLATTAGTISTNAQPNITSTGTLTSLTVSGNVTGQSYVSAATALQTTPVITSALPAAATAGTGARAMVTDADAGSVFGAALTGAGSLTLPVFSDGTIWRVG